MCEERIVLSKCHEKSKPFKKDIQGSCKQINIPYKLNTGDNVTFYIVSKYRKYLIMRLNFNLKR